MTERLLDSRRRFRQPLAAELTKLLTLRATWIISLATLVLCAGIVLLSYSGISLAADERGLSAESIRALMLVPAYLFVGIAVFAAASEYRNGQIKISYAAIPQRMILYSAKLAGLLIVVVPLALLLSAIGLFAHGTDSNPLEFVHSATASLFVLTLLSLVGFGLAIIARNAVMPLVTLWALAALVAPALRASMPAVIQLLPHDLALRALAIPTGVPNGIPQSAAILLLSAWAVASVLVAGVLFAQRDS